MLLENVDFYVQEKFQFYTMIMHILEKRPKHFDQIFFSKIKVEKTQFSNEIYQSGTQWRKLKPIFLH